jgi:hypothetical protein
MSEHDNELRSFYNDAGQGRQPAPPEPAGEPELSDAEERYFQNGGNVSDTDREQLSREHGLSQQTQYERDLEPSPRVRELFQRIVNHADQQTLRAERLDERNRMLMEAMTPPEPQQDHARQRSQERPDPNQDIFATQEYDSNRIARLEQMVADTARHRELQQHDQAEVNFYRQSMDQKVATDPEFRQGYQSWLASRYAELMARRYPDATREQIYGAVGQGRIPADLVQKVVSEERQLIRNAVARGQNPADAIEAAMVGRGFERASVRQWRAEQHRQAQARQRAAERQHEADEDAWFERTARRIAASPGVSYHDSLKDVLPRREDRQRYQEIRARRREQSWPGSGYGQRSMMNTQ